MALLACLDYWEQIGRQYGGADLPGYAGARLHMKRAVMAVQDYERELVAELIDGLRAIPGVAIAGIVAPDRMATRVPTVAMVKDGKTPAELASFLADNQVYVWSGDYYATEIMRRMHRPEGMVRIGIGQYNTRAEIQRLLNLIEAI